MTNEDLELINKVSELNERGAYTVRKNSESIEIHPTNDIEIIKDEEGLTFEIKPNCKDLVLAVPAIITKGGINDKVQNVFNIGENSSVTIIAGCAIDNEDGVSEHEGIHLFNLEEGSEVKYIERHIGLGKGHSNMKTTSDILLGKDAKLIIDTTQIEGIEEATRVTIVETGENSVLDIKEKIMTFGSEKATASYDVNMLGYKSKAHIVSRSVALGDSHQRFESKVNGNEECYAHVECDAITKDNGSVEAIPSIGAWHPDASLVHEATIGKIAGDQLIKLMTIGLSKEDAELEIINGFLK